MDEHPETRIIPAQPGWFVIRWHNDDGDFFHWKEPIIAWQLTVATDYGGDTMTHHPIPITCYGSQDGKEVAIMSPDGRVEIVEEDSFDSEEAFVAKQSKKGAS